MRKRIILFILGMFLLLTITSCSGFVGDESLVISDISTELLEDGRTKIVITYTDEELTPSIFYLPKGDDGVGIKEIKQTPGDDGNSTQLEIFYDDGRATTKLNVPHGVSIVTSSYTVNSETGNTEIVFTYSNGKQSDPIIVYKGEKGDKGDPGVSVVDCIIDEDEFGNQIITFEYSNGEFSDPITIPKGDPGVGIETVGKIDDGEIYALILNYTDGSSVKLDFTRPDNPNTWHSAEGEPDELLGENGDFYYDLDNDIIYSKANNTWITVANLSTDKETVRITFDKNAEDAYLAFEDTEKVIQMGSNFLSAYEEIPVPTRDGYNFVGWYSHPKPNATHGIFTDVTPVYSNIKLFAKWEEIKE